MDNLMRPEERRARHRQWLAGFGFSAEDWRRIRQHAAQVTETYAPPALNDLSVPVTVVTLKANPRYTAGKLGVIRQPGGLLVAVGYYRMDEHERTWWAKRRAALAAGPTSR